MHLHLLVRIPDIFQIWHVIFTIYGVIDMPFLNKHISIESVPGKSYCKVEDDVHIYFIPSEMCREVEDYVHRLTFENHEPTSLRQWYLALPMKKRTAVIVVLNQKIA